MNNGQRAIGKQTNIAIFASGEGSNAKNIIEYFYTNPIIKVALVVCNKPNAGVLQIAANYAIPTLLIEAQQFKNGNAYLPALQQYKIDFISLAGFLWKIPTSLTAFYTNKIINIHPALLPKYGGNGMFGINVHNAVINAKEKQSGITIHYVDDVYDNGKIIFQASCTIEALDTPQTLAAKVQALEHLHYPTVIASVLPNRS